MLIDVSTVKLEKTGHTVRMMNAIMRHWCPIVNFFKKSHFTDAFCMFNISEEIILDYMPWNV